MALSRKERLLWWTARCEEDRGPIRMVIRVKAPDLRMVLPADDLIARIRVHFRNGERRADTMIVGAEGVIEFPIGDRLNDYLTEFMTGDEVNLERFAQVTVLANAVVETIMNDLVPLPDGITTTTAADEWMHLENRARNATLTTLNVMSIRARAHREVSGDLPYEMLSEVTAETLRIVSELGLLDIILGFALKDTCVNAWKFQAKERMLADAKSRRSGGQPKTTRISVIKR